MIEAAVTDIIGPAVAAEDPVGFLDKKTPVAVNVVKEVVTGIAVQLELKLVAVKL